LQRRAWPSPDDNKPPSLTDLTKNDPPDSSFNNSPLLPPGLGGTVPACSILATDPDDANGPNGDDKNPDHGNKHCHLSGASR
jgi:hypothetical protein